MSTDIVDLMDAMVATIQAAALGMAVAAQRDYILPRDLSQMAGVLVTIRPAALSIAALDLSARTADEDGIMAVIQSRTTSDNAAVDPLMGLVKAVARLFVGRHLAGTRARCVRVGSDAPFDPDRLDTDGLFQSTLVFTFRHTQ